MKILLASGSPRRRELLSTLGYDVMVKVPAVTEITSIVGNDFVKLAEHNAKIKADAVSSLVLEQLFDIIIAADTVVISDGMLFGKPTDLHDARAMLTALSGRTHDVVTSYCLIANAQEIIRSVTSQVTFRALSATEIDAYVATNEWTDKAGAYAVQGLGAVLVRDVCGSLTNVIGLPVEEVLRDAIAIIKQP